MESLLRVSAQRLHDDARCGRSSRSVLRVFRSVRRAIGFDHRSVTKGGRAGRARAETSSPLDGFDADLMVMKSDKC